MRQSRSVDKYFLIGFILVVATALRFYGFPNIPFTFDEVSAWSRTNFTDFNQLIHQGVKPDGHPALIQVSLNFIHRWFGDEEWKFKLPFLLMGVASVWWMYRLDAVWFGETSGLLAAAFVATVQFTVMYSQIARPYMSGLFFILLTVRCWSAYLIERRDSVWLIGFAAAAALCAYNHYFSLLVAALVGITGLLFMNSDTRVKYLLACVAAVVLFLPHLSITFHQLGIGGVGGWLAQPTPAFFSHHLGFIFQFSNIVAITSLALAAIGVLLAFSNKYKLHQVVSASQRNALRMVCLLWFVLPLAIGYVYSVFRNPVLQHSVLIFSFPFLVFLLFSFFPTLNWKANAVLVLLLMSVNVYGLVCVRDHYHVFYNQRFDRFIVKSKEAVETHRGKGLLLLNESRAYTSYYLRKRRARIPFVYCSELTATNPIAFGHYVDSISADYVVACNLPHEYLLLVKERYPFLVDKEEGFSYSFFVFSKTNANALVEDTVLARRLVDTNDSLTFSSEFGPTFSAPYYDIISNIHNQLNATVRIDYIPRDSKASIVFSVESSTKQFARLERPLHEFIHPDSSRGTAYLTYNMRNMDIGNSNPTVKVYIWNKNLDTLNVESMRVELEEGNPLVYGLLEPVPKGCSMNAE